jgi:hypothetical protein
MGLVVRTLSSEACRRAQVAGVQGNVPHAEFSWEEFMWGVYQVRRPHPPSLLY